METPQGKLDAARARGHAFLDMMQDDHAFIDAESRFTVGDLRTILTLTRSLWLGREMPHTGSNVR